MLVHAGCIRFKVFVHTESNRDGALLHNLKLDVLNSFDRVRTLGKALVLSVSGSVSTIVTGTGALGSGVRRHVIACNHSGGRGDVVSAALHAVRLTGGSRSIVSPVAAGRYAVLDKPAPGSALLTSVAALT